MTTTRAVLTASTTPRGKRSSCWKTRICLADRLAVRVDQTNLAQSQLAQSRLYLGPVADYDPDQLVRMYDLDCGAGQALYRLGPNLLGEGIIVTVIQPECHDVA